MRERRVKVFFWPRWFGVCVGAILGFVKYFGLSPLPVRVTTRIIAFLVGNPYKPSFATVTGWGVDPIYLYIPRTQMGPLVLIGKVDLQK